METKEKTCEKRISQELESRINEIKEALKNDDKREEFESSILAISKKEVYRVELSWGGPQDYFEIEVDPENREIISIAYHFLDWFDGAERTLTEEDLEVVEQMFGYLAEM